MSRSFDNSINNDNHTKQAELLLDRWPYVERPDPEHFDPEAQASPVMECQIGSIEERPVMAYGVKKAASGITGGPSTGITTVHYHRWDWFLDRKEAIAEHLFHKWYNSEEAVEFSRRVDEELCSSIGVMTQEIGEVDGQPVVVFGVLRAFGWGYTPKLTRKFDEQLAIRRKNLFDKATKPRIQIPSEGLTPENYPEVCEFCYGRCPETGEELYRYAVVDTDRKLAWYDSLEEAEQERSQEIEHLQQRIDEENHRQDLKAASTMYYTAWGRWDNLNSSLRYQNLGHAVDESLVSRFEEVRYMDSPGHDDLDGFLEMAIEYEEAVDALEAALQHEYDSRLHLALEANLETKVKEYLSQVSTCPLCESTYEMSDEWLQDLLVYAEALLPCRCPERGWDRDHEDLPQLAREFQACESLLRCHVELPKSTFSGDKWGAKAVSMRDILVGKTQVLSIMFVYQYPRVKAGVRINMESLLNNPSGKVRTKQVWNQIRRKFNEGVTKYYEREAAREDSDILCLRFAWNGQHGDWSSRQYQEGHLTVYTIHARYDEKVSDEEFHFCRIVSIPEHRQKPNLTFVIVQPVWPASR